MVVRQFQPVRPVLDMESPGGRPVPVYECWRKGSWVLCLVTLISVCVSIKAAPTSPSSLPASTRGRSKGQQEITSAIFSAVSQRMDSRRSFPSQPGTGAILQPNEHEDKTDTSLELSVQTEETQPEVLSIEPATPETQIKAKPFDFSRLEENSTTFEEVLVPNLAFEESQSKHGTTNGKLTREESLNPIHVTTDSEKTKDKTLTANVGTTGKEPTQEEIVTDELVSDSHGVPTDGVENLAVNTNVTSDRNSTTGGSSLSEFPLGSDRDESGPVEEDTEGPVEDDRFWGNATVGKEGAPPRVLRWNIQNDTTYYNRTSLFDDLDPETARRVTIGKVCIMLNGTVVKDMEEEDCRSQAGLHYKYIPARFRTNGTTLNTSSHGYYNTEAYEEGQQETATEESPTNIEEEDSEGETDEMSKSTPDMDRPANIHPDWNATTSQDAVDWTVLNSSETLSNPFEQTMNASDLMNVASDVSSESERETPLKELNKSKKSSVNGSNVQASNSNPVKVTGQMPTKDSLLSKVSSAPPDLPRSKVTSHSLSFTLIDSTSSSSNLSRQWKGTDHTHIYISSETQHNESHQDTANIAAVAAPKQTLPRDGRAKTDPKSPNDHISSGALNDSKATARLHSQTRERNGSTVVVKERRKSGHYPSRENPKIVITYQSGYVPHAIHGLIWEDRHYIFSVLIPIGCGMAGAFLIVCIAYLARNFNSQPTLKVKQVMPPAVAYMDRVMLLADSSDEES